MPGQPKPPEVFQRIIDDADWLLATARAFRNNRARRMRKEVRAKVGEALGIAQKDREVLDGIESEDLFIVIKPGAAVQRDHVEELAPLLRQAVVVACAALETYVAEAVLEQIGPVVRKNGKLPKYLANISLSVEDWKHIKDNYRQRPGRGLRERVLEPRIRQLASTAPGQLGQVVAMLGVRNWATRVDAIRRVEPGTTVRELEELTDRRNRIAHAGDQLGWGRAKITIEDAERFVHVAKEVAKALEHVLGPRPADAATA